MSNNPTPEKKLSLAERLLAAKETVEKGAMAGLSMAREGVETASEHIAKGKDAIDDKTREALDKAYATQRSTAAKNLDRLRAEHPAATPADILAKLEEDLTVIESASNADPDEVITAAALYVLTAIEVHGPADGDDDAEARQRLIDTIVVMNTESAKMVALLGGAALSLIPTGSGAFGKIAGKVAKAGTKFAKFGPLLAMAGLDNPGKKSIAWIVKTVSHNVLGAPPVQWQGTSS